MWMANASSNPHGTTPQSTDSNYSESDPLPAMPEDGLAMVVVPDNDLAPVVAPAIPQLGDMTTPIVVEDYIPLPPLPRRSWRIRLRKEKEKNNEN